MKRLNAYKYLQRSPYFYYHYHHSVKYFQRIAIKQKMPMPKYRISADRIKNTLTHQTNTAIGTETNCHRIIKSEQRQNEIKENTAQRMTKSGQRSNQIKENASPKITKSEQRSDEIKENTAHRSTKCEKQSNEIKEIHIKGIYGKHYFTDYCAVCDISFDKNNPQNLKAHLNGSKHLKNVLSVYSNGYSEKCIYCNAHTHTSELRHAHLSSIKHSDFIKTIIDETRSKYSNDKEWVLSMDEIQKRTMENNVTPKTVKKTTKKNISTNNQIMSAQKIRKAIKECYEQNDKNEILNFLQMLSSKNEDFNEKDHVSILFALSLIVRSNDFEFMTNGMIKLCKIFATASNEWKMSHKLFENMIDVILLSVNLNDFNQETIDFNEESKYLQCFSFLFEFLSDFDLWQDASFESNDAFLYFLKWTNLIFQDMLYDIRSISAKKNVNFLSKYRQFCAWQYIENEADLYENCAFFETKRISAGPFTQITLTTKNENSFLSQSKGSFAILFSQNPKSECINFDDCIIGYIYKTNANAQTVTIRIADSSNNIKSKSVQWHLLSMGASGVTFESQFDALRQISNGTVTENLKNTLFNATNFDETQKEISLILSALFCKLNDSQKNAVQSAMNGKLTLIQGPPGTGKTEVAAAIVEQIQLQKTFESKKVLLSAFSNVAVDVLTQRVNELGFRCLRMGRDSKLCSNKYTLLSSFDPKNWQKMIKFSDILCCTSIGTANELLKNVKFDLILMDETTQSTESGLLVALTKLSPNGRIVLIGDHKQLPPTVCSHSAKRNGFDISLFERLINENNKVTLLDTQYRMHPKLAEFPSTFFYENKLLTGIKKSDRQIPKGFDWPRDNFPICFVQTAEDAMERQTKGMSVENDNEALIVSDIVNKLTMHSDDCLNVMVLTPYSAQKALIEKYVNGDVENWIHVTTVDGFQGSECDVIVFSATRCNEQSIVGFLRDYRRINVMLTRPKHGLIVVGDRKTLENGDRLWREWLKYVCDDNKAIVYT